MSSVQRKIRKLSQQAARPFEEGPWATQAVLAVWALGLGGVTIVLGGFDAPVWYDNAWYRLIAIATVWGGMAWLASQPGNWLSQRGRFAGASSLVVHTIAVLLLALVTIQFLISEKMQSVDRTEVAEKLKVPERVEVVQQVPQERQLFEKPVPTETLVQQSNPTSQQQRNESQPTPPDPTEVPEQVASLPTPQSLVERRPQAALTHRAKSPGERSRKQRTATLTEAEPVRVERPDNQVAKSQPEQEVQPNVQVVRAEPERRPNETQPEEQTTPTPTATSNRRRQSQQATVAENNRPRERTAMAKASMEPTQQVATSQTNPTKQATPLTARAAVEQPRAAASRPGVAPTPVPEVERAVPKTTVARRESNRKSTPLAQSPAPMPRRETVDVAKLETTKPETRQLAEATRIRSDKIDERQPVGPQPTERSRTEPAASVAAVAAPATPSTSAVASNNRRRSEQVTPAPDPSQDQPDSRVTAAAKSAVSADANPDPVSMATSRSATAEPSTSPAPRVLAESRGGTAGSGSGLNADGNAPAAPTYSAPFAAGSARRERATQTERGPALQPNPVARTPHSRADAATPSTTLQAIDVPSAQVAGAKRPEQKSASSSAAVERQFSDAPLADNTLAVGETSIDTGPPRIVPERGSGRGEMGGRMAMQAPEVRRGLGPRRRSQTQMAPVASAPLNPASEQTDPGRSAQIASSAQSSPSGAVRNESQGQPADSMVPRASTAAVPKGRISGGGQTAPPIGPPPAATTIGDAGAPDAGESIAQSEPAPMGEAGSSAPRATGARGRSSATGEGPTVASSAPASRGARSRSASVAGGIASTVDPVALALITPLSPDLSDRGTSGKGTSAAPSMDVERQGATGRQTQVDATEAAGGIASLPSSDPGVAQRIARRQTSPLRITPGRYANRRPGGTPLPSARERRPAPAFAPRTARLDAATPTGPSDPTPKTEAAIELGLEFLAPLQLEDGRWSLSEFGELPIDEAELPSLKADGAATGMALLAFLGAGYDHFDDKYQHTVQQGLNYLVAQQAPDGSIFPERNDASSQLRFYSHGIAALALCEAYGMTGDENLRLPAQKALDYITQTQHRQQYGWRYRDQGGADLSVTGWQMMALRSGELAGLKVSRATYNRLAEFVERCRGKEELAGMFRYNPYITSQNPRNQQHGKNPGTVMTSVGMLMQLYLGSTRDSQQMRRGADHLLKNLPTHGEGERLAPSSTPRNPRRDTYYWYYATQVMFHMGGDYWQRWHEHLHPLLVDNQTQQGPLAGSWNPRRPVADRWAAQGGRIYVTCLNLLSLEVSYRHLPLYEMTGAGE